MINERHKSLRRQIWHPSENELLLFSDGEMDVKLSAKLEAHLKGCWACRIKREETDRLISAFMKSRRSALRASSSSPSGALLRLQARFDELDSELGAPPLFSQLMVSLKQLMLTFQRNRRSSLLSARWATLLAASVLFIIILLRITSAPPVSAREILERVEHEETQRIQKIATPVVYRKLQLRRGSSAPRTPQAVSWEIWNDVTHSRFKQRVEDENGRRFIAEEIERPADRGSVHSASPPLLLIELQQVFRANRMDIRHPLSADAYETWRRTLRQKTEEVTPNKLPDGSSAWTLTTAPAGPFATNAIVKAELIVRTEDWHPVEQRLEVQAKDEVRKYELIETEFDVLAFNALPASIFADMDPLRAPMTISPVAVPTPSPEITAAPSAGELIAAEIEARFALHRAKACLGEALEVITDRFGIKVRGLVDTALRREQLLEALRVIPLTTVEIQTVEEALNANSSVRVGVSVSEEHNTQPVVDYTIPSMNSRLPLQELLRRYFTERGGLDSQAPQTHSVNAQIVELSNEAISLSQSALVEAWALRHLAEWSEAHRTSELRPQLKWLLEVMTRDHTTALRANMSRCRSLLEPVLSSIIGGLSTAEESDLAGPSSLVKDSRWESRCQMLFSQVEQWDRLVRGLFADTGTVEDEADSLRKLLAAFPKIDGQLAEFEGALGADHSTGPDELSLKQRRD